MSEKKFNKLLIKSVKKYPALYDSKCKDYRNRYLKQTVWDKLAAHLDSEVNICKKNWKRLRDKYTKEIHKLADAQIKNESTQSTWKYFKYMEFLQPHLQSKVQITNPYQPQADREKELSLLSAFDNLDKYKDDNIDLAEDKTRTFCDERKIEKKEENVSKCLPDEQSMDVTENYDESKNDTAKENFSEKLVNEMNESKNDDNCFQKDTATALSASGSNDFTRSKSEDSCTAEELLEVFPTSEPHAVDSNNTSKPAEVLLVEKNPDKDETSYPTAAELAVEEEAMSSSESLVGDSTTYSVAPTLADIDSDKVSSVTQASVQPASDANDKISVAEKSIKEESEKSNTESTYASKPKTAVFTQPPASKHVADVFGELVACKLKTMNTEKSNDAMKHIFDYLWLH